MSSSLNSGDGPSLVFPALGKLVEDAEINNNNEDNIFSKLGQKFISILVT